MNKHESLRDKKQENKRDRFVSQILNSIV